MVTAFLSIVGGRIFIVLSSVVLTPILITTLGFELYGRYSTLTAVFGISTILMSSGINSGARKYLSEERSIQDWKTHVFGYYFRLGTVLAVLTALAFAGAARFGLVSEYLGEQYIVGFYGLAGLTIATQFREFSRRSLMGLKQEHLSEPLRVINKVGTRIVLIGIAYVGFEIGGMMVGLIVVNGLVALLALWWLRTNISLRGIFTRSPGGFPTRELFSFNHLSVVYMLFLTSMYHVDVLMLASVVTETQVGYYKSALVISQFLWVIPRSIQSMLIQSVSDLWADGRIDQINEIASRVTRYGMLVVVLLSIGLGALAKDFVPLYLGDGSMPVVTPLLILLPGTIGFAVVRPILAISHAKADMKPLIAATGAAAALNLGLNAVLIPRYGILGAAVATTIGYSSLPVFNLVSARYLGFKPFADARIIRVLATGAIASVPIFLLSVTLENSLLALAVIPPVGFLVFVTVAFLVGAVGIDEALDVMESLPDPIGSHASAALASGGGLSGIGKHSRSTTSWTERHSDTLQRALLVIGILLSLSGVVLAAGVPGVDTDPSIEGESPIPDVNTTEPVTETPPTTNGTQPSDSPSNSSTRSEDPSTDSPTNDSNSTTENSDTESSGTDDSDTTESSGTDDSDTAESSGTENTDTTDDSDTVESSGTDDSDTTESSGTENTDTTDDSDTENTDTTDDSDTAESSGTDDSDTTESSGTDDSDTTDDSTTQDSTTDDSTTQNTTTDDSTTQNTTATENSTTTENATTQNTTTTENTTTQNSTSTENTTTQNSTSTFSDIPTLLMGYQRMSTNWLLSSWFPTGETPWVRSTLSVGFTGIVGSDTI
jgi:O-antigen/teichoic acid export membrane protein